MTESTSPAATPFVDPALLPDLYRIIIHGKCLEPIFRDGAQLLVSKTDQYTLGDFIVIYRRGQCPPIVKRLIMMPPHWVTFPWVPDPAAEIGELFFVETLNPPNSFAHRCRNILAIHKCRGLAPDGPPGAQAAWNAREAAMEAFEAYSNDPDAPAHLRRRA